MKLIKLSPDELSRIQRNIGRLLTEDELKQLPYSYDSFAHFTYTIYKWAVEKHFGKFIGGQFIIDECNFLQENKKTITIEPRAHWKSMRFYAYLMWRIWRNRWDRENIRAQYFSYRKLLADEHMRMLKFLIEESVMPSLGLSDEKSKADTIARYVWKGPGNLRRFSIRAYGLLEFTRGTHSEIVLVDDPLKDDSDPNIRTNVWKINTIFVTVIMNIPVLDGVLHVIGTPQSEDDFYFDTNIQKEFAFRLRPAILTNPDGTERPLWPEMYSLEKLKQMQQSRKVKVSSGVISLFEQEYMCQPRTTTNSYFDLQLLRNCVDESLPFYDLANAHQWEPVHGGYVLAGYDPGKKSDPGHMAVLEVRPDGSIVQLVSKWFDDVDYIADTSSQISQFTYLRRASELFRITTIFADNSRGELQVLEEQGALPNLVPVHLSLRKKQEMAQAIDSYVIQGKLKLLNDPRQFRQLMAVQRDLKVTATSEGHGEPLTSIGLPLSALAKSTYAPRKGIYLIHMF